ncbi:MULTISPECIES: helix-turn-helix domain-containing protein [unclassified Rhizobium]|uniref:helix-turn-helix domain-containing protein n=1 Tax=unclassified Rhizobium TaxID=2613769 RepID=UPI001ADD29AF|nr:MULTISPECIES: helix-turn-helix transcriptional regulator [unclassified Rhizobium]MBO9099381.1 helix-turn-helix transcriptional regulator [Rhizobium sp. L58/93]MBO9185594.1 helix-turn-helix transcriptional regulator [Rhizobium sp. E27B/91]QXZ82349.1 helix-turn-helix transcriptional regulator [Rhizobium sp. K1/93]QXZ90138.1 helix-turn-helix transcriptional regulator [Rhizobium sp. K15/93]QYA02678.1 helix-turn-helix transcriptional regulator [Rhizobium sp. B21/90]
MDAKELLGWNIRKIRVGRQLSQEALAFEARIDRAYLGRVERGKENVTLNVMEALAAVLGVPLGDLFTLPVAGEAKPAALKAGRRRRKIG